MAGDQSQHGSGGDRFGIDATEANERISALERAVRDAQGRAAELEPRTTRLAAEVAEAHRRLRDGGALTHGDLGERIEQLLRLGDERAGDVITAASWDCEDMLGHARAESARVRAKAQQEAEELQAGARRDSAQVRGAVQARADALIGTAARKAEEILGTAEREAATLQAAAEHGTWQKWTTVNPELAQIRASAERESAQLRARVEAEVATVRASAEREAGRLRATATVIVQDARKKADRVFTDLESRLGARREEAERMDAERNESAVTCAAPLVAEVEQRAAAAEELAARAIEQAGQVVGEADKHANQLMDTTREFADHVLAEARRLASNALAQARGEAEGNREAAQREVDDVTRQRDSIIGHMEQLLHLLGLTQDLDEVAGEGALAAARRSRELLMQVQDSGCSVVAVQAPLPGGGEPVSGPEVGSGNGEPVRACG